MADIKNTLEAVAGLQALSIKLIKEIKAGKGITEIALDLAGDSELRAALAAAVDGISLIPAEVKDFDIDEVAQLSGVLVKDVFAVVKALKG